MSPIELTAGALHWLENIGLLGFIGVVVLRRLAGHPPPLEWARARMDVALGAALAGGVGLVAERWMVAGPPSAATVVRVAAEALALVLCLTIGRGAVPAGLIAAAALAFGGHAATVEPAGPAIVLDAIHIGSAGMWAGGIVVLATLRPPDGWRSDEARTLLERFGRVATIAFAMTALTGVLRATEVLTAVSDLWTTPYGLVLAAKTAGVVAMLAMSAVTSRRGVPLARSEAAVAIAVMAATGLLAAFPMPPAGA